MHCKCADLNHNPQSGLSGSIKISISLFSENELIQNEPENPVSFTESYFGKIGLSSLNPPNMAFSADVVQM